MTSKNSRSLHEDDNLIKEFPAKAILVTQNNINEVLFNLEKLKNLRDIALLSSSDSAPVLSVIDSSLTRIASPLVEKDFEKGITENNLVFGGSFPIDAPISAREFGVEKLSKTYQIDIVCCEPPHLCEEHRGIQNIRSLASTVTHSNWPRPSNKNKFTGMIEKHVKHISVEEGVLTYPVDEHCSVKNFHPGNDYIDEDSSCACSDHCDEHEDDEDDDYDYNSNCDLNASYEYEDDIDPCHFEKDRENGDFSSCTGNLHSQNSVPEFSGMFCETDISNEVFPNLSKKVLLSHHFVSNGVFCPQLQTVPEKNVESEDSIHSSPKLNETLPTSNDEDENNDEVPFRTIAA